MPIVAGAAVGTPAAVASSSGRRHGVRVRQRVVPRLDERMHLNAPIVGMAPTASGKGYWLVADDGGIFGFNAPFFGSLGAMHLNSPIVGMAATPTGRGYWLVAGDGGVFTFGDAQFYGSTGAMQLNAADHRSMIAGPEGQGLLADGDRRRRLHVRLAAFHGSTGAMHLNAPVDRHGRDAEGRRLPARRDRRRRVHVRRRELPRFHRQHARRIAGVGSPARRPATATGSPPRTAASSTSATRRNAGNAAAQAARRRARSSRSRACPGTPATACSRCRAPMIIAPPLGLGSSGAAVTSCSSGCSTLGYWLPGVNGVYDSTHAAGRLRVPEVVEPAAHRRVRLSPARLNTAYPARPRSTGGYVIEIDKTRQILIVANGGHTAWVFNASSGSDHPVHRARASATPRTRPRASSTSSARSTATTRARSVSSTGRSTSRHGDRGARLHRRAAVSRVARMHPGLEPGDRLHVGEQHPADRRGRLGLL